MHSQLRGAVLRGGLQTRVVGRAESLRGPSWLAFLLEDGSAVLRGTASAETLAGPVFAWQPWDRQNRLAVAPGTVGAYLLLGATMLGNAIGHQPESRDLRDLADHTFQLSLLRGDPDLARLRQGMSRICEELHENRPASRTIIEAELRILLVALWRRRGARDETPALMSPTQRLFARFVDLVDQRFRERWGVQEYATALGVSRDRLVDICGRARGMTPKSLIDRRTSVEAQLLLENSTYGLQEIAFQLGFQSAAQFNRFFARTVGEPPGRYRLAQLRHPNHETGPESLYEWP